MITDKNEWAEGINHEIDFWKRWLETQGLQWPDVYAYRIDPRAELQSYIADLLKDVHGKPKILDVGAGPMTSLGKLFKGSEIELVATDALADEYMKLPFPDGLPLVRTIMCFSESLSEKFGSEFDVTHACNTIDHSYDPINAIKEMIKVTKSGGYIFTDHAANEAIKENWVGFHQWNFCVDSGDLIISNKEYSFSVRQTIQGFADIKEISQDGSEWVRCVMRKH
jgi:SAM-dependent methyltransferase